MQSTTLSISDFDSVYFGGSETRGCCVCSARRRFVYLQLLAWLPVLSLYADAFITYVFVKSENPTWGGLCALFTAAGWAVSAHQALRHSSLSAAITIALAAVGMGPIAIVVGNKAYVKVKHAHERLNKLKLLVVIVQAAPQCFLKAYIFSRTNSSTAAFNTSTSGLQLASLLMSCASVGWTLSYRFVRMLQMECDGEVCFPLDARASHELQLTVTRSPSARTMLTGTTDTSCIGLLDHVCLPVWLSLCIRSFASLDVAAHVARITIFAVAFRALVIVPLAVVFVLAAIPHLRSRAVNSVDEPAPSVRRKLQQAGTAGVIAVFVNVYSIPEPQPGGVGDALLWWLMDEVMMTLLLTGSVLYSPKLGWSHVNGVCTGLVSFPSAPHKAANCVPQYFFVSLGVAWVATQLLYFVVFAAVLHRRHRELGQLNRSESEASWHTRPIPRTQALNTVSTAIAAQPQRSSQHVIVIQSPPAGSLQAPALRRLEATAIAWLSGSTAASRVHTQVARAEGLTVISSGNSPMRISVTIPQLPADSAAERASKGSPQVPGQSLLSSTRRRQLPNYRGALSPKI